MQKFFAYERGVENKKVIFLLTGWHNKIWMFYPFTKLLARKGFYCITYTYSGNILSPNVEKTVQNLTNVSIDILNRINQLKKGGYTNFAIFGTSLGSVLALMVANRSTDISKIILNTTGADLAETVWSWDHVQKGFKEGLLQQGYTLKKLKSAWKPITPVSNIHNLQKKQILIYLSKNDKLIPFNLGKDLIRTLQEKKYNPQIVINSRLGHVLTGVFNLFNAGVYLKFLNS